MASGISESSVVFFRAAGHSHDGNNASLIDTTKYSIYDFSLADDSATVDKTIKTIRIANKNNFEAYIQQLAKTELTEENLAGLSLYQPTITGGSKGGQIYFDFLGTWNSIALNDETVTIATECTYLRNDAMVVESRAAGNTTLYVRLPAITSGTSPVVQNTTTRQFGVNTSVRELKTDINSLTNSINLVKLLNPVKFKWKSEQDVTTLEKFYVGYDNKYGFIVEDIANVDKSLVTFQYIGEECDCEEDLYASEQNFKPFYYDINGIVSILTASIKELIERVEYLESQLP